MMAQSPKRLNGWLDPGMVLPVSLLIICVFWEPRAHADCDLVQTALTMGPEIQAIVQSKTH
jgi:hypothetical protein